MDIASLKEHFAVPGVLAFDEHGELVRAVITAPTATATVYLQGGHVAEWQPVGTAPILFTSGSSAFKKGKAIRGGVPVIFPWFGDRHDGQPGPAHGFARSETWELAFAAVADDEVHLTLTLAPNETSRSLGFDHFRVAYQLILGTSLTMRLTVANQGESPLLFEEALHSYFAVGDVRKTSVTGLDTVEYIDKRDGGALKTQSNDPLVLTRETDRVYLNTEATCVIDDTGNHRKITIAKKNSATTIVWNPWEELTAKMADMEPDGWESMICIETANAATSAITLAPGEAHTMECVVSVESYSG